MKLILSKEAQNGFEKRLRELSRERIDKRIRFLEKSLNSSSTIWDLDELCSMETELSLCYGEIAERENGYR